MRSTSAGLRVSVTSRPRPYDDRRDRVARTRDEIVEPSEHRIRGERQTHFFGHFAQRRLFRRFTVIDAPAGQRPLSRVIAQRR